LSSKSFARQKAIPVFDLTQWAERLFEVVLLGLHVYGKGVWNSLLQRIITLWYIGKPNFQLLSTRLFAWARGWTLCFLHAWRFGLQLTSFAAVAFSNSVE